MQRQNEESYKSILDQVDRRLEALEKIEEKLYQLQELAEYAASRYLNEKESNEIREWEVFLLRKSKSSTNPLLSALLY